MLTAWQEDDLDKVLASGKMDRKEIEFLDSDWIHLAPTVGPFEAQWLLPVPYPLHMFKNPTFLSSFVCSVWFSLSLSRNKQRLFP
jgi:hypothetical protein